MNKTLNIFSAGVAKKVVSATIEKWNALHPELPAALTVGGSVDLIRRSLSGDPCDLLILADDKIIDSMMMPEKAVGYIIWAGNRMVIAANPGYDISSENWKEKILAPDATFDHHDPYADPGGYRSIMSMLLADKVEPGLSDKLLSHPGHFGMPEDPSDMHEIKYCFDYYTRALDRNAPIAKLPAIMDLSRDELAGIYAEVGFDLDTETRIPATPINHALTIPSAAEHHNSAKEFAKLFMDIDFPSYGFIPRHAVIGQNIL